MHITSVHLSPIYTPYTIHVNFCPICTSLVSTYLQSAYSVLLVSTSVQSAHPVPLVSTLYLPSLWYNSGSRLLNSTSELLLSSNQTTGRKILRPQNWREQYQHSHLKRIRTHNPFDFKYSKNYARSCVPSSLRTHILSQTCHPERMSFHRRRWY